jgi:hypothetical protein
MTTASNNICTNILTNKESTAILGFIPLALSSDFLQIMMGMLLALGEVYLATFDAPYRNY